MADPIRGVDASIDYGFQAWRCPCCGAIYTRKDNAYTCHGLVDCSGSIRNTPHEVVYAPEWKVADATDLRCVIRVEVAA